MLDRPRQDIKKAGLTEGIHGNEHKVAGLSSSMSGDDNSTLEEQGSLSNKHNLDK